MIKYPKKKYTNDTVVELKNVSKTFPLFNSNKDRLIYFICSFLPYFLSSTLNYTKFTALNSINIKIKKGETLGIVGENGSGKSTLLQIIAGIINPSSGGLRVKGKVAALLELGSGFNMELSGYQNIFLIGALLGFSRKKTINLIDKITNFAEIGEFIHQPVKTYSSGMFVRLAFSINISIDPEILIVDEALAVGDAYFQSKCMIEIKALQQKGVTILFVSHDIETIKSLCNRACYIQNGKIKAIGLADAISEKYLKDLRKKKAKKFNKSQQLENYLPSKKINYISVDPNSMNEFDPVKIKEKSQFSNEAKIISIRLFDNLGNDIDEIEFNQDVIIKIYVHTLTKAGINIAFSILDEKMNLIVESSNLHSNSKCLAVEADQQYIVEFKLKLPLRDGPYSLRGQLSLSVNCNVAKMIDISDTIYFQIKPWEMARIWSKVYLFPKLKIKRVK